MNKDDKIYVAGAAGLVGSAICRHLKRAGFERLYAPSSHDLDLTDQKATKSYFKNIKPDYVFVAAAKVGGIWANSNFPADFCYRNLMIALNVIQAAYEAGVKKLLFPGSSCIYPKESRIPISEDSLLTGPFELTNEAYAIAKTAGVKLCEYYRKQFGCNFITVIPTNTFGPNDNFDPNASHMVPALIHKFHLAKIKNDSSVTIWGTGRPRRELIYVDDLADACIFLMERYSEDRPINVGTGEDYAIQEVAQLIGRIVEFEGQLIFDPTKPDGVYRKVMDVSRLKAMGWKPEFSLDQGMSLTCQWFAKNYAQPGNLRK